MRVCSALIGLLLLAVVMGGCSKARTPRKVEMLRQEQHTLFGGIEWDNGPATRPRIVRFYFYAADQPCDVYSFDVALESSDAKGVVGDKTRDEFNARAGSCDCEAYSAGGVITFQGTECVNSDPLITVGLDTSDKSLVIEGLRIQDTSGTANNFGGIRWSTQEGARAKNDRNVIFQFPNLCVNPFHVALVGGLQGTTVQEAATMTADAFNNQNSGCGCYAYVAGGTVVNFACLGNISDPAVSVMLDAPNNELRIDGLRIKDR